jgi:hypothetical protein
VRVQRRKKLFGFAIYVAIISATVAWFAFLMPPDFSNSEATESPDADHDSRYSGKIVLREWGGGCRRLSFDNDTGALQDRGVAACKDTSSATNSTEGRMKEIRGAFRK